MGSRVARYRRGTTGSVRSGHAARLSATALALTLSAAGPALALCSDQSVELQGDWGRARFNVEVADAPDERALGLMDRKVMPRSHGMLFVYDHPQPVSFWMRNTLIPLDMLFLDGSGTVQRIHENAIPLDETPIPGGEAIQYVLEINGGLARALGITEGSALRHDSIDQDGAAWPCDAP